jgi:acyl carrier protein
MSVAGQAAKDIIQRELYRVIGSDLESLPLSTEIEESGLDSLKLSEAVLSLEHQLGIVLDDDALTAISDCGTIGDVIDLLAANL